VSIDASIRSQLARAARNPRLRNRGAFGPGRPTKWHPAKVINPEGGLDAPFTLAGAWGLIASKLESGHHVDVIDLRKPLGAKASTTPSMSEAL
jgi:hypothetical protein